MSRLKIFLWIKILFCDHSSALLTETESPQPTTEEIMVLLSLRNNIIWVLLL